jgi:hypothetical protein
VAKSGEGKQVQHSPSTENRFCLVQFRDSPTHPAKPPPPSPSPSKSTKIFLRVLRKTLPPSSHLSPLGETPCKILSQSFKCIAWQMFSSSRCSACCFVANGVLEVKMGYGLASFQGCATACIHTWDLSLDQIPCHTLALHQRVASEAICTV